MILVLALIVLGPDRLPSAARQAGRWIGELRRMTASVQAEVQDVVDEVMRPVHETTTAATDFSAATVSDDVATTQPETTVAAPAEVEVTEPPAPEPPAVRPVDELNASWRSPSRLAVGAAAVADPSRRGDDGLTKMSLRDHLAELRRRLIISILAVGSGAVVAFVIYNRLLDFLTDPVLRPEAGQDRARGHLRPRSSPTRSTALRPGSRSSAYLGLVLALPIVLYQLWRFITPGPPPKEKKYAIPFIVSSLVLFGLGSADRHTHVPERAELPRLGQRQQRRGAVRAREVHQPLHADHAGLRAGLRVPRRPRLPATRQDPVTGKLMKAWRGATIGIFAFAAVITPSQDPYSMLGMALPMVFFYFLAAGIGKLLGR